MSLLNQFSALEAREIVKYDFEHICFTLVDLRSTTAPKYSSLCVVTFSKTGLGGIHWSGSLTIQEKILSPECKPKVLSVRRS